MMESQARDAYAELLERLEFIGLNKAALGDLNAISAHIEKHLPDALAGFYEKLVKVPAVSRFFDGAPQMQRAQGRQSEHWLAIAKGKFDRDYLESSRKVGLRHARIGLEPRWYIGGYGLSLEGLITGVIADIAAAQTEPKKPGLFGRGKAEPIDTAALSRALSVMVKAVMVDIDMAVSIYFDKLTEDAAERDRIAKGKIERAVQMTADTLKKLASGDLTARVTEAFEPEFQQIKDDTNGVADRFEEIVVRLRETSRSLRTATGEILSGANDLSERTTRQAATIEETSAAMEQLMHTVGDNAKRADQASAKAGSASALAVEGGAVMSQANDAMQRITASSEKISNIIGMIDDIAFQTNLLALNASVEAARAGEAGKGFAVVAVEVRRLAQSAAQASSDVKELIDQSEKQVRGGTQLVGDATRKLEHIVTAVQENSDLMRDIAEASGSQTSAIQQINVAVRQMDEMTQHNAALVEETNAAIEQTEAQAAELDTIVDVFRTSAVAGRTDRPMTRRPKAA